MKIRKLLEIQSVIEDKAIPNDIKSLEPYYSNALGDIVDILDMDLNQLIKAYKFIDQKYTKFDSLVSWDFINTMKSYVRTLKK
jgi:hypothetical protein|tara:strand:+ start:4 stop:252 length:249 start_codon:yes stop_codon:yes gene_type:complete